VRYLLPERTRNSRTVISNSYKQRS
jgi:hypothetical protein